MPRVRVSYVFVAIGAVLIGALVTWSVMTVFVPSGGQSRGRAVFATSANGSIGSSITLNVEAHWNTIGTVRNQSAGVVTSVGVTDGASVTPGAVLYTVNLRPVVAGVGSVPAFRDLGLNSSGQDVAQVQTLLSALGYFHGAASGRFRYDTRSAVLAWQRSLGETADGDVRAGDVVFFPALPSRISLDPSAVAVGASLSGGEKAIRVLGSAPSFDIPVDPDQASAIPAHASVVIDGPGKKEWEAAVHDRQASSGNNVVLGLGNVGTSPICGDDCDAIAVGKTSLFTARVVLIPTLTGVTVPTAAIVSDAAGRTGVVKSDGRFVFVRLLASDGGTSVVRGLRAGIRVQMNPGSLK